MTIILFVNVKGSALAMDHSMWGCYGACERNPFISPGSCFFVLSMSIVYGEDQESFAYLGFGTLYNASVKDTGKISGYLTRALVVSH